MDAKPFLKWVGGKTQLLDTILSHFPESFRNYYEPFIGGGALFFRLANLGKFEKASINDFNPELVNAYRVVRDDVEALIEALRPMPIEKDFYLELRKSAPTDPVEMAARTIYLNKTGFNGLYRLNKSGGFNVPWGSHKNPRPLNEELLRACNKVLQEVGISNVDFSNAVEDAQEGDLVYLDPPYIPLSDTSNFRSYTADGFDYKDQERVANCVRALAAKGVSVIASNSGSPLVRELYEGLNIVEVEARRSINSKGDKRGRIKELLIVETK